MLGRFCEEYHACDHIIVCGDNDASMEGCRFVVVVQDVGTSFMRTYDGIPSDEIYFALTGFVSDKDTLGAVYNVKAVDISTQYCN